MFRCFSSRNNAGFIYFNFILLLYILPVTVARELFIFIFTFSTMSIWYFVRLLVHEQRKKHTRSLMIYSIHSKRIYHFGYKFCRNQQEREKEKQARFYNLKHDHQHRYSMVIFFQLWHIKTLLRCVEFITNNNHNQQTNQPTSTAEIINVTSFVIVIQASLIMMGFFFHSAICLIFSS